MTSLLRRTAFFVLLPALWLAVEPAYGEAGGTGAEILRMGAGARAAGLAETQTALADDVYAFHWNPAGLGLLRSPEISFMNNQSFEDVAQQSLAAALPVKRIGSIGAAVDRLAVEDLQGYDAQGAATRQLDSESRVFSFSWGRRLLARGAASQGVFGGVTLKSLREEHAEVDGDALAADLGFLWRPWHIDAGRWAWLQRLSVGVAARNLGKGPKFDEETTPLPRETAVGLGHSTFLSGDILTLGADLRLPKGEKSFGSLAAEYWHRGLFALRLGYMTGLQNDAGLRAGAGLNVGRVQVDYAWAGFGDDLGPSHRLSLTLRFGRGPAAGFADDYFKHHMEKGKSYMGRNEPNKAVLHFHQALRIRPQDPEAMALLLESGKKMQGTP